MDGRTSTPRDQGAEKVTRPRWRDSRRQQVTDREWPGVGRVRKEAVEGVLMVGWPQEGQGCQGCTWKRKAENTAGQGGPSRQAGERAEPDNSPHRVASTQRHCSASVGRQGSEGLWDMPTWGHSLTKPGHWPFRGSHSSWGSCPSTVCPLLSGLCSPLPPPPPAQLLPISWGPATHAEVMAR